MPHRGVTLPFCITLLLVSIALHAQVDVLTNRYDSARTGANLSETTLTTANVSAARFGKLYSLPVDGSVYAQPLYATRVTVGGVVRNVLYVATMNDKVYAFDADSSSTSPLWMRDFTSPPAITPVPITDIVAADRNIVGNVGIQSTPVIDLAAGTMYLVARTKESGTYVQRLHALSITTGQERSGSPVTITGSVAGTAPDAAGSLITFDPKIHVQRAGLALSNGVVLVAWAAHEDLTPSHGWLMAFDSATLARVAVFAVTRDAYLGGIWQGGRAPAIDASGNVYIATANGKWDGTRNFGNSLLKFSVSRSGLTLLDYFTPSNEVLLSDADYDLSGSGFTLLPGTNLLLGGGKEGVLYLLNKDNLGRKVSGDTQIPQKIPVNGGHVMGGPVYWNSPAGPLIYNWSEEDVLKSYRLSGGLLNTVPYAQGQVVSPGHPGGSLTVSANGSLAGTGIVWASMPTSQDGIHGRVAGILRAYNAETLAEIWNSEQSPTRDRLGTLMKFVPPVVANGRVYLPNQDNKVAVYGLLPRDSGGPGAISVDFAGSSAVRMDPSEVAGVAARSHWNNAAGAVQTSPMPLVDETGTPTGATVAWMANGAWQTPITDQPGNRRMMKGYLDTSSTSTSSITVSGLIQRVYDVYVYVDGDNGSYSRTGAYTISGSGITTGTVNLTDPPSTNFSSAFTQGADSSGNYVRFRVNAGAFTLTATPGAASGTTRRAPINALQIVPVVTASLAAFSVNFVGNAPMPMGSAETAGVVNLPHWNNAAGAARTTPLALVDATGAATNASMTWTAFGTWSTPITDAAGNRRLMKGYVDTSSTSSTSIAVSGLTSATYDVYVYADGDNRSYSRTAAYTISGAGITTTTVKLTDAGGTDYAGSFKQANGSAGNYVKFTVTGTAFTLTAVPVTGSTTTLRAPVNAIQIVPR